MTDHDKRSLLIVLSIPAIILLAFSVSCYNSGLEEAARYERNIFTGQIQWELSKSGGEHAN